jgi:hypothetical protein
VTCKIVYVYPIVGNGQYLELALRFLKTYHNYPAGYPHESIVVCNGGEPNDEVRFMFGAMEDVRFIHHNNCGWDISAHQHAAWENPDADMMLFFGSSAYIKGAGWLARFVQAREKHGDTLYGTMGNRGAEHIGVYPHIRTTSFSMSSELMNRCPFRVTNSSQRYAFEHGEDCLTSWIRKIGKIPYVVSWSGVWRWEQWDSFPGGYHRHAQQDMIAGDKNSCPPYYHCF